MLFKRRKNDPEKLEPKSPPQPDPIWESFRKADGDWCCKVYQNMIKDGLPHITVQTPARDVIVMPVRYCPRCGRKL